MTEQYVVAIPATQLLQHVLELQAIVFPTLLKSLLIEHGQTINTLYDYLLEQGYEMDYNAFRRYFNPSPRTRRIPDEHFLAYFARFLALSDRDTEALMFVWRLKRRRVRSEDSSSGR